ncbi:28032_t:CDS:2, partial [Dentiscutata erythropus]
MEIPKAELADQQCSDSEKSDQTSFTQDYEKYKEKKKRKDRKRKEERKEREQEKTFFKDMEKKDEKMYTLM